MGAAQSQQIHVAVKDFRIVLNERVVYSGSAVTGNVILEVEEPKTFKQISVVVVGRAQAPQEVGVFYVDNYTMVYPRTEFYDIGNMTVWNNEQSTDGRLAPGRYTFPFRVDIPSSTPSSFEGTGGYIRFAVQAHIWAAVAALQMKPLSVHHIDCPLRIQQLIRITDPTLLQPQCFEEQKSVLFSSSPIVLKVQLPKTGFCIGEPLNLIVSIENGSRRHPTLNASLFQQVVCSDSRGPVNHSEKTILSVDSNKIPSKCKQEWKPDIRIPPTDTFDDKSCSIIQVSYRLDVKAMIPWSQHDIKIVIPLKVGCEVDQPTPVTDIPDPPRSIKSDPFRHIRRPGVIPTYIETSLSAIGEPLNFPGANINPQMAGFQQQQLAQAANFNPQIPQQWTPQAAGSSYPQVPTRPWPQPSVSNFPPLTQQWLPQAPQMPTPQLWPPQPPPSNLPPQMSTPQQWPPQPPASNPLSQMPSTLQQSNEIYQQLASNPELMQQVLSQLQLGGELPQPTPQQPTEAPEPSAPEKNPKELPPEASSPPATTTCTSDVPPPSYEETLKNL